MTGLAGNVAKIRIVGLPETVAKMGDLVVDALESAGITVIEWSKPYPCQEPDEDKQRVFITALVGKENIQQESSDGKSSE